MAVNIQDLLKNKTVLIAVGGVIVLVVVIIIAIAVMSGSKSSSNGNSSTDGGDAVHKAATPIKEDIELLKTDNLGKALEIQALLAKENIRVTRTVDGTKSSLILSKKDKMTMDDRDRALIAIVKSGYMDQNVGLEVFDKGDFTSTKEDKKIRLSRAINGELSRLIRKFDEIENASVFVSIPETTMFKSDQKPITATVQLVIKNGERLPDIKIRAIQNLLLGSIQGIDPSHISITDTNGNVYNSIISAEDDLIAKMQENDQYMTQKVQAQLDKLIGKGNYVVTVSTQLREVPLEKTSLQYHPDSKTAVSEQVFSEGLGDKTSDSTKGLNAVTTYLPSGLPAGASSSAQSRKYERTAKETQYGISKTQTSEYLSPGVIEEISIAVTLDQSSVPPNTSLEELKHLIAAAASPRAKTENVTIVFSESGSPFLAGEKPESLPVAEPSGNPKWLAGLGVLAIIFVAMFMMNNLNKKFKSDVEQQAMEMADIRARAEEQEKQIQDVNLKAAELIERQTQLAQNMLEVKTTAQQSQQNIAAKQQEYQNPALPELMETVNSITQDVDDIDIDDFANEMQSWIERS